MGFSIAKLPIIVAVCLVEHTVYYNIVSRDSETTSIVVLIEYAHVKSEEEGVNW